MYRLRFIYIMLSCLFSKPKHILDPYDLYFTAIPLFDADVSRLFTQTYGAWGGLGRWHYVFASPFRKVATKNRWIPVTAAETFIYKKSIRVGEKVNMKTQIACWNEQRFFLRQTFLVKGEVRAIGMTEGMVRNSQGHLKPTEVFKVFGANLESPEMPEDIKMWCSLRQISK